MCAVAHRCECWAAMKDEYLRSKRQAKRLLRSFGECELPAPVHVQSLTTLRGHPARVRKVAPLRGGRIATVAFDGIVRVYERNATAPYLTIGVPVRQVSCICAVHGDSDNGVDALVVGGADGQIVTLGGHDGRMLCTTRMACGSARVCDVGVLGSEHIIVATKYDLFLVRHESGRELRLVGRIRNAHGRINSYVGKILSVSCAHNAIVTRGSDWVVNVWDPKTLTRRARLLHTGAIVDVEVTPTLIVTASSRGEVRLYHNHPNSCVLFRVLREIHIDSRIVSLGSMFLGASSTIMVAAADGKLAFIDEDGERCVALVSAPVFTTAACTLPDRTLFIAQPSALDCFIATLPRSLVCERRSRRRAFVAASFPVVPTALIAVTVLGMLAFYVSRRRA